MVTENTGLRIQGPVAARIMCQSWPCMSRERACPGESRHHHQMHKALDKKMEESAVGKMAGLTWELPVLCVSFPILGWGPADCAESKNRGNLTR